MFLALILALMITFCLHDDPRSIISGFLLVLYNPRPFFEPFSTDYF